MPEIDTNISGRPLDLNDLMTRLVVLQSAANLAAPVHLDLNCSINIGHVTRCEQVETTEEKTTGEGKAAKTEIVGTGQFVPAIFFVGSDDAIFLTPEQNAVFREVWQRHARVVAEIYAIEDLFLTPLETAAPQLELVPPIEQVPDPAA